VAIVQVVVVVELVVAAAQSEHRRGVEHVRVVDHERLDDAIELIARADEVVHRVVVRARFMRYLAQEESAQRRRVVEMMIDFRRELVRLVRQQIGHGEVRVAVVHLRVGRGQIAGQFEAHRIQPAGRNLVVGKRHTCERILDDHLCAIARDALEIARQLRRGRHQDGRLLRLIVDVFFTREPEERFILHNRSAIPPRRCASISGTFC
jgi:hypothetical protein